MKFIHVNIKIACICIIKTKVEIQSIKLNEIKNETFELKKSSRHLYFG